MLKRLLFDGGLLKLEYPFGFETDSSHESYVHQHAPALSRLYEPVSVHHLAADFSEEFPEPLQRQPPTPAAGFANMASGGYGKRLDVRNKVSGNNEEFYKRTLARVQKIQNHLDETPRGGRLKDKVCIITGVGSLKGIGCVVVKAVRMHQTRTDRFLGIGLVRWLQASHGTAVCSCGCVFDTTSFIAILNLRSGARHLYLLDFDGTNLPELKATIESKYPDVKVCPTRK